MKAASTDLGVAREPDVRADVTVVTGYVTLPRHPRSEKEYGELAAKVFTPLCKSFRVRAFYETLDACWLWRLLKAHKFKVSHLLADNANKNSLAYHCVIHQKFEWLLRAAIDDPDADSFIWLDYGIAHLQGLSVGVIEQFLRNIRKNDFAIPGCWPKDQLVISNLAPCWRFCGAVLVVPRAHLLTLYNAARRDVIEQLATTRNVSWEVNTLAHIESGLPIRWYQADHDGSMFRNYGKF
jgi:hypothetical protein